jgi:hypothetical protein
MKIMLYLMKNEIKGEIADLHADMANISLRSSSTFYLRRLAKISALQSTSSTRPLTNSRNTKRRRMPKITKVIRMLFHPTMVKSKAKPIRLRDCYPEPHRRILQKGPPQSPPCWQTGTRRECNL